MWILIFEFDKAKIRGKLIAEMEIQGKRRERMALGWFWLASGEIFGNDGGHLRPDYKAFAENFLPINDNERTKEE